MNYLSRFLGKQNPTRRELSAIADAAVADLRAAMPTGSCSPLAISNRVAHLRLSAAITKSSVDALITELDRLGPEPLTVEISASIGLGDQALRAFQALRAVAKTSRLTTIASGDVSGPGLVAFMAGDTRIAQPGSNLGITPPIAFADGSAKAFTTAAQALENVEKATISTISARAKLRPQDVAKLMADAEPIGPQDALLLGLATATAPSAQATAQATSPAIRGAAVGFRPPPLPTNQQTNKPTMTTKPPAPAKPAKPAPVTAYQQFIKISAINPIQGGIFKLRNKDAIIASMPADAPPIQF